MTTNNGSQAWIGYDWFKLIVAVIIALLIFWVSFALPQITPVTVVATVIPIAPTAAPVPTALPAPTAAPVPTALPAPTAAQLAIGSPSDGSQIALGQLSISGVGPAGATIEILNNGTLIGEATIGPNGTWSFEYTPTGPGVLLLTTRTKGSSVASTPISVTITAAQPGTAATALLINAPSEGAQLPVGPITISGTGLAGSVIEILDSDRIIGQATVAADGTWSITYTPSSAGTASLTVRSNGGDSATKPVRITLGTGVQPSCAALAIGCDAWVTRGASSHYGYGARPEPINQSLHVCLLAHN